MTAVDRDDVQAAVDALREDGRILINSNDIAEEIGIDSDGGTLSAIGRKLPDLDDVEVASRGGSSNTFRIRDNQTVATDGGGFDITLDRTHVREGEDIKEIWKATVDNADVYQEIGGETPGDALRGLADEFDDEFGAEPRTDGGEPDLVARIDGTEAARVEGEMRDGPLFVWREDGQLYKWADFYLDGPQETTVGIINTLNSPRADVEYVPHDEVPYLSEQGEEEVATDGGHDLEALCEGIASTVAADDDRTRHYGEFAFRAREDWGGRPGKHVIVDAAHGDRPNWIILPFGLADVVLDELERRLDDPEPMTDGGRTNIGQITGASTIEVEGQAVLAVEGTDGTATVHVPEDMVLPLQDVVDDLPLIYDDDAGEETAVPDGGTDGAVDNDYDDGERPARDQLVDRIADAAGREHAAMRAGDLAFDLVTRQPVRLLRKSADTVVEFYEREDFDLATYNQHLYLPVRLDDPVFECVFVGGLDDLHKLSDTYDYPAGRLVRVPTEVVANGGDD